MIVTNLRSKNANISSGFVRLDENNVFDMGIDEFYSCGISFIEWSDR
jgi:hypothetical protein